MARTQEEITAFINKYTWYHKIDLGNNIITPGYNWEQLWNLTRSVRAKIDYTGKKVLDLGSLEGMWAFEAENLGAASVVATDVCYEGFVEKFHFCKEILKSSVIPYYNVSPYDLFNRLDVFLQECCEEHELSNRLFDIVQHLGLLYHLQNPMLSLAQARSVIKDGGTLIFETAAVTNVNQPVMLFNGSTMGNKYIYEDHTTWWAPTISCLKEMLASCLFQVDDENIRVMNSTEKDGLKIGRVALTATALSKDSVDPVLYREVTNTYRNPGLMIKRNY